MNIVLRAIVGEFATSFEYDNLKLDKQYEYLSSYCVLASHLRDMTISKDILDETVIGGGNDWGIDGFAIIINGRPVNSKEEIDCIADSNSQLRTTIILIQGKTSESFDSGNFNKFTTGATNIVKTIVGKGKIPDQICERLQLKNEALKYLFAKYGAKLKNESGKSLPSIELHYAHAGETESTTEAEAIIDTTYNTLDAARLFSDIKINIISGSRIHSLYDETNRRLECVLTLDKHLPLPTVDLIKESHLCLLPFSEFKKLIIDTDGSLMRKVFEDNVRDFQGNNPVNMGIERSLVDKEFKLFTAMNNGVTITCRDMSIVGNKMTLWDYQIVNGCQTCNVLYRNRKLKGINDLVLSVKIISSTDKDIRDKIIVANNSQTVVERAQLTSLLNTQRKIESFYIAQDKYTKLYYERRSKQYRQGQEKIPAGRIVTIPSQIFSFMSMVLEEPHHTRKYYGDLIRSSSDQEKFFSEENKPAFYFMSALAAYYRDRFFSLGELPEKYKKIKHHLLLAFRLVASDDNMPCLNSNSAEKYCDRICSLLCDETEALQTFKKAVTLLQKAVGEREPNDKDATDSDLTKRIKEVYYREKQASTAKPVTKGTESDTNPQYDYISAKPMVKIVGKIDLDKINCRLRPKRK